MPGMYNRDHLDLLHVPYFSIPIFYHHPYIVTIHDLTVLHVMTGRATTLPYPFYFLKKLGFLLILRIGLHKARSIIVPSRAVKDEIVKYFHVRQDKIHVTHEGIDPSLIHIQKASFTNNFKLSVLKNPYFLYVGNAYPHKNLEALVDAFEGFSMERSDGIVYRLVLVGKDDIFYERLKQIIQRRHLDRHVIFYGQATDQELRILYQKALALMCPSLMEGFGLPALEAATLGIPVICSDIPVFHEILGDIPIYIKPNDVNDIRRGFSLVTDLRKHTPVGHAKVQQYLLDKFSWARLGKETIRWYREAANSH